MSEAMLVAENLSAWYGAARILYDLNFQVNRGEVVAMMGRNGAGKSTTMKTIMGLMARRQGTVSFNGEDISNRKPFEIARRGLGFTPEDRRIFVDLTVMENLDVGRQSARHFADGRPAPSWTPEQLFRLFPNLAEMPDRLGSRMSGGEQQMLTVARTLMGNPLLFCVKRRERRCGYAGCNLHRRFGCAPPAIGERDGAAAAVLGIAKCGDKAAQMQAINHALDGRRIEIDKPAEIIL
jgi:ABC-type lipopolysaccharide export system ATPase subunit